MAKHAHSQQPHEFAPGHGPTRCCNMPYSHPVHKPSWAKIKSRSTITPAIPNCKKFAFAQCIVCKNVYQVGQRGRLPRCPSCTGLLYRITHLEGY